MCVGVIQMGLYDDLEEMKQEFVYKKVDEMEKRGEITFRSELDKKRYLKNLVEGLLIN